jgi:hypothetical protein
VSRVALAGRKLHALDQWISTNPAVFLDVLGKMPFV